MAAPVAWIPRVLSFGFDKLGVVVAALLAVGAVAPFAVFRANRIVAGEAKLFFEALPPLSAALFALVVFAAAIVSLSRTPPRARLATAVAFAIAAAGLIGIAADHLTPPATASAGSRRVQASGCSLSPTRSSSPIPSCV